MKKLLTIILATILSLTFLYSNSSTINASPVKHEITRTVVDLYYMADSGYYVIQTNREADGGSWMLELVTVSTKKENKQLTKVLSKMFIGKTVHIAYSEDVETDEEVDILDTWIE